MKVSFLSDFLSLACPPTVRGAGLRTREHIVFECRTHEDYGGIIDEGAPDHQLATLFGTKTGIDALAEFVRKTKAFQKPRAMEIP